MKRVSGFLRAMTVILASVAVQAEVASAQDSATRRFDVSRVKKVLFLGNSITLHGPAPSIGWSGNWGMAATAEEKDYVHVLLEHISQKAGTAPKVKIKNVADFERRLTDYDLKSELKEELEFEADLVIVALGENATAPKTPDEGIRFRKAFSELFAELKRHGRPTLFVRSQFWSDAEKDRLMKEACEEAKGTFVDVGKLGREESNYARAERKIEHAGVAGHPGDKGMRELADALWEAIRDRAVATDWPRWRGSKANGVSDVGHPPTHWSVSENVRWSVKLPGWGTSSPVVYGDRVFVTSQSETEGKKSLQVFCFDRDTGKEVWKNDFGLEVDQRTHEKSNLAVNTPAVTDDAVYVAYGNADIARYSHAGELQWVRRYLRDFTDPKMAWGYCISPLVVDDAVIFPWDHHSGPCFLIGLDKQNGEIAWKKDRPIGTAHATPLFVEAHGQKMLLVPGKNRLTAFDAKTHEPLWVYGDGAGPYNGEIISSPVYADGVVYLQLWRQSPIHAIRLNANGSPPTPLWISKDPGPVEPSLLNYRGRLYAWLDHGVLTCLNDKTGEILFRQRLGSNCNSSPVASDGRIYLSDNDGKTYVIRAGDTFDLLATNELGERITATPAVLGDELLYRTDSHLYLIGNRP